MATEKKEMAMKDALKLVARAEFKGEDPKVPGDKLYYSKEAKMWLRLSPLPGNRAMISLTPGACNC
jgi:hypothetical protein